MKWCLKKRGKETQGEGKRHGSVSWRVSEEAAFVAVCRFRDLCYFRTTCAAKRHFALKKKTWEEHFPPFRWDENWETWRANSKEQRCRDHSFHLREFWRSCCWRMFVRKVGNLTPSVQKRHPKSVWPPLKRLRDVTSFLMVCSKWLTRILFLFLSFLSYSLLLWRLPLL